MASRDIVEIRTSLSLAEVKSVFSSTLQAESPKVEFGPVPPSDNPFSAAEDFAAYGSLKTLLGGWIVQIYVTDEGAARVVNLVPVGSSALARSFAGLKNTVSKSTSREKAQTVVAAFRAADPALAQV